MNSVGAGSRTHNFLFRKTVITLQPQPAAVCGMPICVVKLFHRERPRKEMRYQCAIKSLLHMNQYFTIKVINDKNYTGSGNYTIHTVTHEMKKKTDF